ncbi:hypothetical protein ASD00_32615 [Ensifer sp. Root31]|uniref:zeta toxin family protein n=1 Tax=Ensifer sp. Root31 TaxID=1736512 RepID=UPI00070ABA86|nr:zeta toxin family protein [Ensifer sp. Root31]KQU85432.1 hypothetical protein ASD00_32615 [Ensifer sp. Root31]
MVKNQETALHRGSAISLLGDVDSGDEDSLLMSADRCSYIYDRKIAPANLVKEGVRGRPQFWIVAGENGIGKTTAMDNIAARLRGPTQKICPDDLVKYVDGYHDLAAKDPGMAQEEAREFTPEWCDKLRDDAGEMGAHILVECSMPLGMQEDIEFAESWGYETVLYLIAEPREISWTAVVDRTDKALKSDHIGTNAMVSDRGHTQRYAAWPRAIFDAERDVNFDRIVIARRDGTIMYENRREQRDGSKRWMKKPQGLDVLLLERHRGLSTDQIQWLDNTWQRLASSPQLKGDRFMRSMPLDQYKNSILTRANSAGSRFDPFVHQAASNAQAAAEWHNHLVRDLELVKTSRNNLGPSEQFDKHLDRYAEALIDQAYRPPPQSAPIRRLGQASLLPSKPVRHSPGSRAPASEPKRSSTTTELTGSLNDAFNEETRQTKRPRLEERTRTGHQR